jgi:hypothetical protein
MHAHIYKPKHSKKYQNLGISRFVYIRITNKLKYESCEGGTKSQPYSGPNPCSQPNFGQNPNYNI